PRPVGARRTATALTQRTGWPVRTEDVRALVASGHLAVAGRYEGRPLYDRGQAAAIPAEALATLVRPRVAKMASRSGHRGGRDVPPGVAIQAYADHLADTYGLEVATAYRPASGRWLLDWPVTADGTPDPAALRPDLHTHPAGVWRRLVDLATPAHRAVAAARRALASGAVVL